MLITQPHTSKRPLSISSADAHYISQITAVLTGISQVNVPVIANGKADELPGSHFALSSGCASNGNHGNEWAQVHPHHKCAGIHE